MGVWTSTYSSHPLLTNCLWPWAGSSCLSVKTKKYHKLNQRWLHYSYWYYQGYQHYLCYWYEQYYQQTTCVAFPVPLNNQRSHSVDICCRPLSGSKALSSREDFQRAKLPWLRSSLLVVWLSKQSKAWLQPLRKRLMILDRKLMFAKKSAFLEFVSYNNRISISFRFFRL